jgi:hypothetical protein
MSHGRPAKASARRDVSEADQWIGLNPINSRANLAYRLNCARNCVLQGIGLTSEVYDDVALLKCDKGVVATGVIEASLKVLSLWIETRGDDAELKRFHPPSPRGACTGLRFVESGAHGFLHF